MANNIKVTLNNTAIANLNKKLAIIVEKTAEATKPEILNSGKVPIETNNLRQSSKVVSDKQNCKASILFTEPYAKRLYYHPEYNFKGTGEGLWMDDFVNGNRNAWVINTFKNLCSKYL